MAVASPRSTETLDANPDASNPPSTAPVDPSTAAVFTSGPSEAPTANASMPIPNPAPVAPPPPAVPSFAPSFRPLGVAPVPQYSAVPTPMAPNPSFMAPIGQAPGIQPPGVSAPPSVMPPGSFPTMRPGAPYQVAPGQPPMAAPMHYGQIGNGYATVPPPQAPMGIPPGMPRYPSPYPAMIRPGFPMRPILPTGMVPQLPRPPIPNIRGVPPVVTPVIRPVIPLVAPAEKPQTTVYVGKIAATVENEFLLSILTLCGPVKSWKRAQDPSDGKPKGFGFCEYETAEGVLRSLRLLSKLNIDGQELVVNIKQATREYLERYVEKKKTEKEKLKEAESGGPAKENDSKEDFEKQEPLKPVAEETEKETEDGVKENHESNKKFGIVTDEDREADRDALEKLTAMIEERMKNKPLPPPLPLDGSAKSTSEVPSKSRDGDSDVDIMRSDAAEDKIDEETTSENKPATESDKPETGSPDRSRRHDRSKERDRDRDSKREKERELERVERDRERDRIRRDREREMKLREAERLYKERLKEWEGREREKEYHRQYEKDREKERERERRKEIMRQEEESSDDDADDSRKKRRRSSFLEERKRKRKREKEEDLEDRLKEEEEIVEAKRRAAEEQQLKADLKSLGQVSLDYENPTAQEEEICVEEKQSVPDQAKEVSANGINNVDVISRNNSADDLNIAPVATSDTKQSNAPARKLGFGLIGSGKRTTVPSVFHEEDDAEEDEKKMRPLVPIDYSTEELQAVQTSASGPQANLAAAAEFAKRISGINTKEEKSDGDRENRERSRRSTDKLNFRERDRNDDESNRHREESREKLHERNVDKEKSRDDKPKTENKKLLDAKQLIDMIPKTKEELFVYEIDWDIYDKHQLHERMRPWISKKITEFLGEEEATLVDYIVSCIKDHVQASTMLEMLQSILDDEAEMFVLKMWRMLIFEIKKIETGLAIKSKS